MNKDKVSNEQNEILEKLLKKAIRQIEKGKFASIEERDKTWERLLQEAVVKEEEQDYE